MRTLPSFPLLLLGASLAAGAAGAYPISPLTLWELTAKADLVVLARVGELTEVKGEDDDWASDVALLDVREVYKGKLPAGHADAGDRVPVRYSRGMMCPAPARYVEKETVLAFLAGPDDDGRYRTVGLSYGTLYPEVDELDVFTERIRAAVKLQAKEAPSSADERWWRVKTAARAATRWHGAYRLAPEYDRVHAYYDRSEHKPLSAGLTAREMRILARGFAEEPTLDPTLPMMLALLAGYPSADVDAAAVAAVDVLVRGERPPWYVDQAIELTLARFGHEPVTSGPEQDGDPFVEGVHVEELAFARWRALRPGLDVEPRLIEVRRPRVFGVGANTPP